jgi:hypothetical protein
MLFTVQYHEVPLLSPPLFTLSSLFLFLFLLLLLSVALLLQVVRPLPQGVCYSGLVL